MANPLSRIRDKNKGSKLLKSILLDKVISSTNIVNLIWFSFASWAIFSPVGLNTKLAMSVEVGIPCGT